MAIERVGQTAVKEEGEEEEEGISPSYWFHIEPNKNDVWFGGAEVCNEFLFFLYGHVEGEFCFFVF